MSQRIGALTISQRPRKDLLRPYYQTFPDCDIIEAGALDTIDVSDLSDGQDSDYPLTTTLNNGDMVTLDRDFLDPLLQSALNKLESQRCTVNILLCAGDFPNLQPEDSLLIKPTDSAHYILRAMNITKVAVISPIAIQNKPIQAKWKKAGFQPKVWTMIDADFDYKRVNWINQQLTLHPDVECVVLDYVGYPMESIYHFQKKVKKPLFELGQLAISVMQSIGL